MFGGKNIHFRNWALALKEVLGLMYLHNAANKVQHHIVAGLPLSWKTLEKTNVNLNYSSMTGQYTASLWEGIVLNVFSFQILQF